jgi:hypothetical protein
MTSIKRDLMVSLNTVILTNAKRKSISLPQYDRKY